MKKTIFQKRKNNAQVSMSNTARKPILSKGWGGFLGLLMLISSIANAIPCYVNIPDANFKAALISNLAINTNSNSEIECSEATAYTGEINVNTLSIANLTGIEAFTAITTLKCNYNNLTSLNVSSNIALTTL